MNKPTGIDFETYYNTAEGYGIREMGTEAYLNDPRFDAYMISVSDGTDSWAGEPKNFNWDAIAECQPLAHNASFDFRVYNRMVVLGRAPALPALQQEWICTANMSMYLCSRRDLKKAAEFLLPGVVINKDTRDYANGKTWADIVKDGRSAEMIEYAATDALRCVQMFLKYGHLWSDFERQVSALTISQSTRGCQVDVKKLDQYLITAKLMLLNSERSIPWVAEGKSAGSTKALAEECRKYGIPAKPVKKREGEEAFELWVETWAPKHPWVRVYADHARIGKLVNTLETIKTRLNSDGVISYDLMYFGAHTGRWSGGGGFNMQNMRKDSYWRDRTTNYLCVDPTDEQRKDGTHEALDIRSLFVARPGKRLMVADLAQIEPRVLAWVTGNKPMLEMMAQGQSPYEAHARATNLWSGEQSLKAASKTDQQAKYLYAMAKAMVLGLGYGCGWKKFITVAMTMAGLDVTKDDPEFVPVMVMVDGNLVQARGKDGKPKFESGLGTGSKKIVNEFRASNPLITGLWKQLDAGFKLSIGGDFEMALPSGRSLKYREVKNEYRVVEDPEDPKKFKRKFVTSALMFDQKVFSVVRKSLYGGLLTENLIQAIARDVFAFIMLQLEATPGIKNLFHVHDETVLEVDNHISVKQVESIMSIAPPWLPGCPIAAEVVETPCYLK